MRLNLAYFVFCFIAPIYGAPVKASNCLSIPHLNAQGCETHTSSAVSIQKRAPNPTDVRIRFSDKYAAPPETWPPTSTLVSTLLTDLIKTWLRSEAQPTNIKLVFNNVFIGEYSEPYSFVIGETAWPAQCSIDSSSHRVEDRIPCSGFFLGGVWVIARGQNRLYRTDKSTAPSLFPAHPDSLLDAKKNQ
ncbi:hypothetical protein J3R30DRAFT_2163639 [Lentinula aciculospora]|uniref:Uncharacterized protein n=1 Tax=Lentinula aciculospora TaxID=153920 RepID=A0A9W9AGN7_9AGAR|nr:hypothetical protein J3R30DRAFT_2163639 [Lentinula aciculospora]